jgi:hypothetical protein
MSAAARRPTRSPQPLTADDVQRRLPLLRAIVSDINRLHRDIADRRERVASIRKLPGGKRREGSVYAEELEQIDDGIRRDEETLRGYVGELENLGGILRDPDVGRIEFAGRNEGRKVFFGWTLGDEDLGYWRPSDSAESDRHSLLEGSVPQDDDAT